MAAAVGFTISMYALAVGEFTISEISLLTAFLAYAADTLPVERRTQGLALYGLSGLVPIGVATLASDVILREASLTAKAKPLIVSMGSAAASGGYYASVAGKEIFERLRGLDLPARDHAVFGSAPLLIRGIIDTVDDLDILSRGSAWERACSAELILPDGSEGFHENCGIRIQGGAFTVVNINDTDGDNRPDDQDGFIRSITTPVVGPDRDNKRDNHSNAVFKTEGDELRKFICSTA